MQNSHKYEKGIKIDAGPQQIAVVIVMFVILFVLPIITHRVYTSSKYPQPEETYTAEAIAEAQQGQVAGISSEKAGNQYASYTIPIINYSFTTDFSQPANLMVIVGTGFTLIALVLLGNLIVDFAKK